MTEFSEIEPNSTFLVDF